MTRVRYGAMVLRGVPPSSGSLTPVLNPAVQSREEVARQASIPSIGHVPGRTTHGMCAGMPRHRLKVKSSRHAPLFYLILNGSGRGSVSI